MTGLVMMLLIFVSCSKTSTCTCRGSLGQVNAQTTLTSSEPGGLNSFDNQCEENSTYESLTVNGVTETTEYPCELTKD